jgi:hypothetical protein
MPGYFVSNADGDSRSVRPNPASAQNDTGAPAVTQNIRGPQVRAQVDPSHEVAGGSCKNCGKPITELESSCTNPPPAQPEVKYDWEPE